MKFKTIYIADDGTEFQNEQECFNYEHDVKIQQFQSSALLFDKYGHILPLERKNFEVAWFIKCKTDDAAKYLYDEFCGWATPWDHIERDNVRAGCWIYSDETWKTADEFLEITEILKRIMDM